MTSRSLASGPPYLVSANEAYQSISMHPARQNVSFEELRMQEYIAGRIITKHDSTRIPDSVVFRVNPVAGPIHCRNPIRASRDDSRKLDGEVVVFLVGDTQAPKRFTIHEDFVKDSSEFVRLALRGDWKEASTRQIPLPDDEPAVFSVYQHWLYNGLIHSVQQGLGSVAQSDEEYELLVKAYIFGEKIIDLSFKNSVVDAIIERVSEFGFNKRLTCLVFDNTTSASPLRRLWLDIYYHLGNVEWLEPALAGDTISPEFMIEFSRYQMQKRALSSPGDKLDFSLGCTYHEH